MTEPSILNMNNLATENESIRQYMICNACRHCEGFCPVWDAMERRNFLDAKDIKYFSYLCHDCRDCFYACPYSEPHEYGLNIPKLNSDTRVEIHRNETWPKPLTRILNGTYVAGTGVLLISAVLLFLVVIYLSGLSSLYSPQPSVYSVVPYDFLVIVGMVLGIYVIAMWMIQGAFFWRDIGGDRSSILKLKYHFLAIKDVISHRWFKGGGVGCDYPQENGTKTRMIFHMLMFFGILLAIVATSSAAVIQHLIGYLPPYPLLSLPVLSGTSGGLMIIVGSIGFLYMKSISDKSKANSTMIKMDYWVVYLLLFTAITGMFALITRSYSYMGLVFLIHLTFVGTLYIIAPYSKLNHIIFRYLAIVKEKSEVGEQLKAVKTTSFARQG